MANIARQAQGPDDRLRPRRAADRASRASARALLGVGLIAAVAGCQPTSAVPLGTDTYQIKLQPAWYTVPTELAPNHLAREALDLCPRGYDRLQDWVAEIEGDPVLVWNIRCQA